MSVPPSEPDADLPEPSADRVAKLEALAERIGHDFADLTLLDRALIHASMGNEGLPSYERLEFLGDSVLGFIVSDHLYHDRPDSVTEGQLTEQRSRVVSRKPLSLVAKRLDLMETLRIGRGMQNRDLESRRIHADLVEAVLGAIYLDGGIEAARAFVHRHVIRERADRTLRSAGPLLDAKTRLQHMTQSRGLGTPEYTLVSEEGPGHDREFTFSCAVDGTVYGSGSGSTKRKAQTLAAARTLELFEAVNDARNGEDPVDDPPSRRAPTTSAESPPDHGETARNHRESGNGQT